MSFRPTTREATTPTRRPRMSDKNAPTPSPSAHATPSKPTTNTMTSPTRNNSNSAGNNNVNSKLARNEAVKVAVRCRPMSTMESDRGCKPCVSVDKQYSSIRIEQAPEANDTKDRGDARSHQFTFDYVFPPDTTQTQIFDETAKTIVDSVLQGYNGTIFAYGQTGTGKTHTMEGVVGNEELQGIMPKAFKYLFERVSAWPEDSEFLVKASFLEIYLDEVYDLLNKQEKRKKMELKRDPDRGVFVKDLTSDITKSPEDLLKLLKEGQKQRRVGATAMNAGSSRSHCVYTIIVEASSVNATSGDTSYRQGKLNFVDLAGSERQNKSKAEGERMEEAKHINLSLSALGNVIKALTSPHPQFVPFRDSKLTRLLEDSLGGNTRTVMLANIGPADYNASETLSTLRYADRAKRIQNKPRVNEDPKDAKLRQMQEEIVLLRAKIIARQRNIDFDSLSHEEKLELGKQQATDVVNKKDKREVIKVKIQNSGYRIEDMMQILEKTKQEEAEMENKSDMEKNDILRRKVEAEMKLASLQSELKSNQELLEIEEKEVQNLRTMLGQKEIELIRGGGQVELAAKHRQELEKAEMELEKRQNERQMVEERSKALEMEFLDVNKTFASAEAEAEALRLTIKEITSHLAKTKEMIETSQQEAAEERSLLIEQVRVLDHQTHLRSAILETYIPISFYKKIELSRQYDHHNDSWDILGFDIANDLKEATVQGVTEYADLYSNDTTPQANRKFGGEDVDSIDETRFEKTFLQQRRNIVLKQYLAKNPTLQAYLRSGALEDAPFVVNLMKNNNGSSSSAGTR